LVLVTTNEGVSKWQKTALISLPGDANRSFRELQERLAARLDGTARPPLTGLISLIIKKPPWHYLLVGYAGEAWFITGS